MSDAIPADLEAEQSLLGCILLSGAALDELDGQVAPEYFYRGAHRTIYEAAQRLRAAGSGVDAVTVADELDRGGQLDDVGGRPFLAELAGKPPSAGSAVHYASIVARKARRRTAADELARARQAVLNGSSEDEVDAALARVAAVAAAQATTATGERATDGAGFVLDTPATVPAVWGREDRTLWAQGEPLLIVGPPGVGKTTLAQQLTLARIGLRDELLSLPVEHSSSRVLYVAADRPAQSARSMRRMVSDADRARLTERLVVWRGPLLFDVVAAPERLVMLARRLEVDTVVIDSLKDVAPGLEKPEVGSAVNMALQGLVAGGIDVAALHHQRGATADNRKPNRLDDVYGSVWLTAGAGSVVLLWGQAGDPLVELRHLKQPAEDCGPLTVLHDHIAGMTTVQGVIDVLALLRGTARGMTARRLAEILGDTAEPDRQHVEKARRRLEALVAKGRAHKRDGSRGGAGGGAAATYFATDDRRMEPL